MLNVGVASILAGVEKPSGRDPISCFQTIPRSWFIAFGLVILLRPGIAYFVQSMTKTSSYSSFTGPLALGLVLLCAAPPRLSMLRGLFWPLANLHIDDDTLNLAEQLTVVGVVISFVSLAVWSLAGIRFIASTAEATWSICLTVTIVAAIVCICYSGGLLMRKRSGQQSIKTWIKVFNRLWSVIVLVQVLVGAINFWYIIRLISKNTILTLSVVSVAEMILGLVCGCIVRVWSVSTRRSATLTSVLLISDHWTSLAVLFIKLAFPQPEADVIVIFPLLFVLLQSATLAMCAIILRSCTSYLSSHTDFAIASGKAIRANGAQNKDRSSICSDDVEDVVYEVTFSGHTQTQADNVTDTSEVYLRRRRSVVTDVDNTSIEKLCDKESDKLIWDAYDTERKRNSWARRQSFVGDAVNRVTSFDVRASTPLRRRHKTHNGATSSSTKGPKSKAAEFVSPLIGRVRNVTGDISRAGATKLRQWTGGYTEFQRFHNDNSPQSDEANTPMDNADATNVRRRHWTDTLTERLPAFRLRHATEQVSYRRTYSMLDDDKSSADNIGCALEPHLAVEILTSDGSDVEKLNPGKEKGYEDDFKLTGNITENLVSNPTGYFNSATLDEESGSSIVTYSNDLARRTANIDRIVLSLRESTDDSISD